MTHTPGPWTTTPGPFWICDIGNNVADPGVWSEFPVKDGESFPFGPKEDDARLIAAAPELLEALKAMLADYDRAQWMRTADMHFNCKCDRCNRDAAEVIIAKATGAA
jgi:cation diffusion facilitator CzcD-associated flavoprotein CzcO